MRVLYCVSQLALRGGAERIVISKMNALVRHYGVEVHVLIADQKGRDYAYPLDSSVQVHDMCVSSYVPNRVVPFISFFQTCQRLKQVYADKIQQICPDVVLVIERGFDDFVIPFICKDIPRLREFHSSREAANIRANAVEGKLRRLSVKLQNKLVYSLFNKYDGVVVLTQRDLNYSHYSNATYVIPNFIPQIPKEQSSLDKKNVISVGRLDKNKNFKDQILAWEKVAKKHSDWTLHIYGEGPERFSLEQLIKTLNLCDKVILHGNVSNIDDFYLESSFCLFTSKAEGFGMVLIEAMSFGLPCISYDAPCGPSEIISEGKDGFLVSMDDISTLEKRINYLIENQEARCSMGTAARKKAEKFTEAVVMPQWISLFNQLKKIK